ncbi:MAG: tRNA (adenosine(37)-N6)-threonylcarbamoyltransferase complex dimerization subunit type 1 TsaB [Calditrichia bacterium]
MGSTEDKNIILGIESSGLTSAVSLSVNGHFLGEISLQIPHIHSRSMALMIEQLLDHTGYRIQDLSSVGLSAGPGSFTGLRIGYSLAKGLAHAQSIPVVEVPTLDIWAYQSGAAEMPVIAFIDARREEVFAGRYTREGESLKLQGEYDLLHWKTLASSISVPTLFSGPDILKFRPRIEEFTDNKARFPYPLPVAPAASVFQKLILEKFERGKLSSAENCEPLYMRAFQGVM